MSIKLNHFICPHCGHDFYAEGAYATCDGCQLVFYVASSQTYQPKYQPRIVTPNGSGLFNGGFMFSNTGS